MDKRMIYNIINLPKIIGNKSYKNVGSYENIEKIYTQEEEDMLHNKRYIESVKSSVAIQLATKFYITGDYINFVEDNNINMYEIKEFINYEFKKPYEDKPLLIQTSRDQSVGLNLIIDTIPNEIKIKEKRNIKKHNLYYSVKVFFYNAGEVVTDINYWLFSKDIFKHIANKDKGFFYIKVKESLKTKSSPPESQLIRLGNDIRTALYYYFAATYLKDILPIFETKEVKGRKPFIGKIDTKQKIINLPLWEHKVITIKPNFLRDMGYDKNNKNGKRLHDVRGHFRHYCNGKISWISPYKRGNAELGVIKVDGYNLDFKRRAKS